jgi:hypothetical protein
LAFTGARSIRKDVPSCLGWYLLITRDYIGDFVVSNTISLSTFIAYYEDMTHRAFPAFFLTLPYSSYDTSYAIALTVVFGLIGLLTIQVMKDIKMYTS